MAGHLRQRSPGSWQITVEGPKDEKGQRKPIIKTIKGNKKTAEKVMRQIQTEIDTGTFLRPSKLTVAEYLEKWLVDYARANTTAKTRERYTELIQRNIVPALGGLPLEKLEPLHIQSFYSRALEEGRLDGKGGLSAKTVIQMHRVLRESMKHAVKWRLRATNPADDAEPPRAPRPKVNAFGEEHVARLLEAVQGSPLYLPVLLGVATGMRRGEILGLQWQDVDLKAGTLVVRQSLEETKTGVRLKSTKNEKSRAVVLPTLAVEVLSRHQREQFRQRQEAGPDFRDEWGGLVLAWADGTPVRPHYVTLAFSRIARKLNLPSTRFHDLRHSHATQLMSEGIHPKVVSDRLGHSGIGITLDTYSHVTPALQEEAARRVDASLRRAMEG